MGSPLTLLDDVDVLGLELGLRPKQVPLDPCRLGDETFDLDLDPEPERTVSGPQDGL